MSVLLPEVPTPSRASEPILWRIALPVPPTVAYAVWTDPAMHQRFLCERSIPVIGGYELHFINGAVTQLVLERAEAPNLLAMRYFDAEVLITFQGQGGHCDLTLTTTGFLPEERSDIESGWVSVLWALKTMLVTGRDLRIHDPRKTWNERYVDQ